MSIELFHNLSSALSNCFSFDNDQNQQCNWSGLVLPILGSVAIMLTTTWLCLKNRQIKLIKEQEPTQLDLDLELYEASSNGLTDAIDRLIEQGAKINGPPGAKTTPLHYAANPATIQKLLECRADLEAQDAAGKTPLQTATEGTGSADVVAKLLDSGANPKVVDKEGNTLLHLATKRSSFEGSKKIEVLHEKGADLEARNAEQETPLRTACRNREVSVKWVIEKLLALGADKNAQDGNGNTPMHIAAWYHNVRALRALVSAGANKEITNKLGETPLQKAEFTETTFHRKKEIEQVREILS